MNKKVNKKSNKKYLMTINLWAHARTIKYINLMDSHNKKKQTVIFTLTILVTKSSV